MTIIEDEEPEHLPHDHPTKIPAVYVRDFDMKCEKCKYTFAPVPAKMVLANPDSQEYHTCPCPNCGWRYKMRINLAKDGSYLIDRHHEMEEDANWLPLAVNAAVWPLLIFCSLWMLAWYFGAL